MAAAAAAGAGAGAGVGAAAAADAAPAALQRPPQQQQQQQKQQQQQQPYIGPLPTSKTVTITAVPDWTTPGPTSMFIVLGPPNTTPQHATWCFELTIWCTEASLSTKRDDEGGVGVGILRGQRVLLWHNGKSCPNFAHAIVPSGCKLHTDDELKSVSVAIRTYSDEKEDNAMMYCRRKLSSPTAVAAPGYLRIIHGHHYYFNLTFAAGSTIAQLVGTHGWKPIIYVVSVSPRADHRLFTNFVTNWGHGVEMGPDDREKKVGEVALQLDAADEMKQKQLYVAAGLTVPVAMPGAMPAVMPGAMPGSVTAPVRGAVPLGAPTAPTSKAEVFQNALAPMNTGSVVDTTIWKTDITYYDLEWALHSKRLLHVVLPPINPKLLPPPYPITAKVERFWNVTDAPIKAVMISLEAMARNVSVDPRHPASDAAKLFLSLGITMTELVGWQHFALFVASEATFLERLQAARAILENEEKEQDVNIVPCLAVNVADTAAVAEALKTANVMDQLQLQGQELLFHLYKRMEWSLALQKKAGRAFDAEVCIKLLAAEKEWMADVAGYVRAVEIKLMALLYQHRDKFLRFKELQRKGVPWPHSLAARRCIEAAGFTYRPMILKRDRCVCETCGAEVYGWKAYHDPMSFHVFAKHPPAYQPPMLQSATSMAVSQLVTEANMRKPTDPPTIANAAASTAAAATAV